MHIDPTKNRWRFLVDNSWSCLWPRHKGKMKHIDIKAKHVEKDKEQEARSCWQTRLLNIQADTSQVKIRRIMKNRKKIAYIQTVSRFVPRAGRAIVLQRRVLVEIRKPTLPLNWCKTASGSNVSGRHNLITPSPPAVATAARRLSGDEGI